MIAIGATTFSNHGGGEYSGHVRVFQFKDSSNDWEQQVGEDIDGEADGDGDGDESGRVSPSGDGNKTVAIGAPGNNGNGFGSGHVRVYKLEVS